MEPGAQLGHYTLLSEIGRGGMGVVWKAKDTKLDREVAIKTLPAEFARDAERLSRFEREAKLLASVNHPNIAAIYGIEEHEDSRFLVLELVEGDTIADRLLGGALPLEDSLKLALQIAEALEAAHEKGVIHRDLKPANIKVTKDGQVKVLDFGLAKAYAVAEPEVSESPTLSIAATQQGMILGTAAYMSPEQARGQEVDKRTDIWAFGCVLLEMLTGRQAFPGDIASDILAAVIRAAPEWHGYPSGAHPSLRRLLERCLEKDPRQRWRDIGDVRVDLSAIALDPTGATIPREETVAADSGIVPRLGWAVASVLAVGVLMLLLRIGGESENPVTAATLQISLPEGVYLAVENEHPTVVLSPDGTRLAFVGVEDGVRYLYRRDLDDPQYTTVRIEGTEGVESPFFSPDGQRIGFLADSALKTVSVDSGVPVEVAYTSPPSVNRGATWASGDTFVYSRSGNDGLTTIQPGRDGGVLQLADWFDITQMPSAWPEAVPGERQVLFTDRSAGSDTGNVSVLLLDEGQVSTVINGGTSPKYSAASGHVLYARAGTLYAIEYDPQTGETGDERVVTRGIETSETGAAHFAVARNGTLAYVAGGLTRVEHELVWVDREGNVTEVVRDDGRRFFVPRLSPDDSRIAFDGFAGPGTDVFVLDRTRNDVQSWTSDIGEDFGPLWHPTNGGLAFSTEIGQPSEIGPALGWMTGPDQATEQLYSRPGVGNWELPASFSPDGRWLAFKAFENGVDSDLYVWSFETGDIEPFIVTDTARESSPMFSPNGDWVAYVSDRDGPEDVWISRFPEGMPTVKVSTNGGTEPMWSPDGRELYYRDASNLMMVTFSEGTGMPDAPQVLFSDPFERGSWDRGLLANYDVSLDGSRFLMVRRRNPLRPTVIQVVLNWPVVYGFAGQE